MIETSIVWGTKAETLENLRLWLKNSVILPSVYFSAELWQQTPERFLALIQQMATDKLIVRSSAQNEDAATSSLAGAYKSYLNVSASSMVDITNAVHNVIDSFGVNNDPNNQVLIQPMLTAVQMSGVVMTHDLQKGAPYYTINYDDESGVTDTITGGTGIQKTVLICRNTCLSQVKSERLRQVLKATQELETLCGNVPLDIEFAVDANRTVYIFQVRRISVCNRWHPVTERRVNRQLEHVSLFLRSQLGEKRGVYGKRSIFGSMPDWNPAEIIGSFARPLSSSLYRYLVTDSVWSQARALIGYHHVRHQPLMYVIGHHPYIDVRASFNSFLPQNVAAETAEKLIDGWIDYLSRHPELHDKVEFEVAQTCMDFQFNQHFEQRYAGLLTDIQFSEYRQQLSALTSDAISGSCKGNLKDSLKFIADRADRQQPKSGSNCLLDISVLLHECRDIGVLHFAIIARHAFIAEALMRSASAQGAFTAERLQLWKQSIQTVSYQFTNDYDAVLDGRLSSHSFFATYGHLRPGTYDITSLRYDERVDLFKLKGEAPFATANSERAFNWSHEEILALQGLIDKQGWQLKAEELLSYACQAIAGREYAKLVFTRDLSDALDILVQWGADAGLSREDLSFLNIETILQLMVNPLLDEADRILLQEVEKLRHQYEQGALLRLSHLILSPEDVYIVPLYRAMPNFITESYIEAAVFILNSATDASMELAGKIVCIENADPGYDWIFTQEIAGLVTKFGGTNSHMAIRCAEHRVPAAIGCGEQLFNSLVNGRSMILNCRDKKLNMV
ncbi:PEP/pyruvate-binding domain-containing protein [Rheinheimera sp. FR7-31]|uniref:PEP/pyruvate-binding domain-containing protein n=1 Tax=Rheinheimera fenheensis TaxID=3152295 RepID=UPI00325F04CA